MKNTSFWNLTAEKKNYIKLDQSIETEVLIIGGGITGVSCAYFIAQKGIVPVLIEAGSLCDGTSGNTTGKVTIQHGVIYSKLIEKHGFEYAKMYADSQNSALDFIKEIIKKESIECQYAENTSYLYALAKNDLLQLQNEYASAKKLGINAEMIHNSMFPEKDVSMLGFNNQAVFHPVRYIEVLAKKAAIHGAKIYCNTKAIKIKDGSPITVLCEDGIEIKTKHLVMATQYPIYDGPNIFYTRLYPKRAYAIAILPKNDWPDGSYINISNPTRSIRTHIENGNRMMIIAGDGHHTGRGDTNMEEHYNNLINFAEKIVGIKTMLARWSAQDYETPDEIPYIGRISEHSNIYAATGYKKWGLTTGTLAGNMISELIESGKCHFEKLYAKDRKDFLSAPGKTITEVMGSIGELIKSKIELTEKLGDLKQGEGRVINFKGQKAGIYRDFNDNVTILDVSCRHMSTELNFNNAEKTWDCPAHGGRYNTDGKLLEGPPKDSLKVLFTGNYSDLISRN